MTACGIFEKPLPESQNILEALSPLKHKKSFSSDSLEGLGFDRFESHDDLCCRDGERKVRRDERGEASKAAFPPPISSIGRSGKPGVCFKSCREDGRFILKQVSVPTQEFLHACRQHGRLQLHLAEGHNNQP